MLISVRSAAIALAAASVSFAATIPSRSVSGNYIEARTADVYTGPCFANGEVEQVGHEAVFGWKIKNGAWDGVDVAGLSVVGVVGAEHTLGNIAEPVNRARAVVVVDSRATAEQAKALVSFAKHQAGDLLKDIVQVDTAPIEFTLKDNDVHGGTAKLTAGSLAEIQTRAMNAGDHICGNEDVYYPPLNQTDHAMPAYSLENTYTGTGLDETWHSRLRRSAFVGTFHATAE
jgi:hypothetical protein